VPVSLAALERAIELNGVAVAANRIAFAIGRLAAGQPQALDELADIPPLEEIHPNESLTKLVERFAAFLSEYQDVAYAANYRRLVEKVRHTETALVGTATELRLTAAVARSYFKLLAYKDEYEVARLYTNGEFKRQLQAQFEGDFRLEFHMAPPLIARSGKDGSAPKKVALGPWLWPLLRVLAKGKALRGSWLDIFGHTAERRMERKLLRDYAILMSSLLPKLTRDNLDLLISIAAIPMQIRGYGHVKLASVAVAKARESELLARLDSMGAEHRANKAGSLLESIPIVTRAH
jgi:indolepyruvate ferredoxin oxidoreductase